MGEKTNSVKVREVSRGRLRRGGHWEQGEGRAVPLRAPDTWRCLRHPEGAHLVSRAQPRGGDIRWRRGTGDPSRLGKENGQRQQEPARAEPRTGPKGEQGYSDTSRAMRPWLASEAGAQQA